MASTTAAQKPTLLDQYRILIVPEEPEAQPLSAFITDFEAVLMNIEVCRYTAGGGFESHNTRLPENIRNEAIRTIRESRGIFIHRMHYATQLIQNSKEYSIRCKDTQFNDLFAENEKDFEGFKANEGPEDRILEMLDKVDQAAAKPSLCKRICGCFGKKKEFSV